MTWGQTRYVSMYISHRVTVWNCSKQNWFSLGLNLNAWYQEVCRSRLWQLCHLRLAYAITTDIQGVLRSANPACDRWNTFCFSCAQPSQQVWGLPCQHPWCIGLWQGMQPSILVGFRKWSCLLLVWVPWDKLLHSLHNLISSSAHSSVVRGHVEFLLVFLESDLVMRSLWGLSHTGSPREETRLLSR